MKSQGKCGGRRGRVGAWDAEAVSLGFQTDLAPDSRVKHVTIYLPVEPLF